MKTRTTILALAVVAALCTAVPAMGGPTVSSVVKQTLKTAKKADRRAKVADARSKQALSQAGKPGPQGPAGPQGATGRQGAAGPQGRAGLSGVEIVRAFSDSNSDSPKSVLAFCPAGKRVIGTGGVVDGGYAGGNAPNTLSNVPLRGIQTVAAGIVEVSAVEASPHAGNWRVIAEATCANVD